MTKLIFNYLQHFSPPVAKIRLERQVVMVQLDGCYHFKGVWDSDIPQHFWFWDNSAFDEWCKEFTDFCPDGVESVALQVCEQKIAIEKRTDSTTNTSGDEWN